MYIYTHIHIHTRTHEKKIQTHLIGGDVRRV